MSAPAPLPPHNLPHHPPCLHARPQAENDTSATTNPYTTNLSNRQPIVEAQVGIGSASVRVVDSSVMAGLASTGLSTHLVKLGPCSSLAPHYHPTADEMQLVLEGEPQPPPTAHPCTSCCALAPGARQLRRCAQPLRCKAAGPALALTYSTAPCLPLLQAP